MRKAHQGSAVPRAQRWRWGRVLATVGLLGGLLCPLLDPLGGLAQATASPPFDVAFAARMDVTAGLTPVSVALGDVNGDGHVDMVVANFGWLTDCPDCRIGTISVHLGDGAGTFSATTTYEIGNELSWLTLSDVDGDTDLDLVVSAGGTGNVRVFLGDGTGRFEEFFLVSDGFSNASGSVAVGDFDGHGLADVAAPSGSASEVKVWIDASEAAYYDIGIAAAAAAVAGDLDGDGDLDLVTVSKPFNRDGTLSVLRGNGDGSFALAGEYPVGVGPTSVVAADLDRDGDLDLATTNSSSATVSVLLGNGDGTFQPRTDFATGAGARAIATADLNGDEIPDLATADFDADTVSVLVGDGSGGFAAPTAFATGPGPVSVATGDLDGDGVPDLAVANATIDDPPPPPYGGPEPAVGTVSVLLNRSILKVPGAPTILRNATAANGQATVSWMAPASDGGSTISGYVVTPYIGHFPLPPRTFNSTATTQTVSGLTNGTTYRFRVQAINAVGTGAYSKVTNRVTPTA